MNRLSLERCIALKEAGFPQKYKHAPCTKETNGHDASEHTFMSQPCGNPEFNSTANPADCPSLSELIEELHKTKQFASLRFVEDEWIASEWDDVDSSPRKEKGRGATPEIAVANLYLAIN